jgi:hypothetical protein
VLAVGAAAIAALLWLGPQARADESNKLTNFTFSKAVQLPGMHLDPGRYRFELADPVESRKVIRVSTEDGKKQIGMLLTIPITLPDPAKDAAIMFGETPSGDADAIKAWVYPGERTGYEFIYPHDQAVTLAKRYHTSVLSKHGDRIERVNENGESVPQD